MGKDGLHWALEDYWNGISHIHNLKYSMESILCDDILQSFKMEVPKSDSGGDLGLQRLRLRLPSYNLSFYNYRNIIFGVSGTIVRYQLTITFNLLLRYRGLTDEAVYCSSWQVALRLLDELCPCMQLQSGSLRGGPWNSYKL